MGTNFFWYIISYYEIIYLLIRRLKTLDLHGVRHGDVDRLVENFVFLEYPNIVQIITGNSERMKTLVKDVLDRHDFKYTEGDFVNNGYITVNT